MMNPADLEAIVHRELSRLPVPRAPLTLLPRVLTAVHAWSHRPWYQRAWFMWPVRWQAVSTAALILLVAGGAMLIPHAETGADRARSMFAADVIGSVSQIVRGTESMLTAARVLWRAMVQPVAPYAFALLGLMAFACALFGTALNHVISGRMLTR